MADSPIDALFQFSGAGLSLIGGMNQARLRKAAFEEQVKQEEIRKTQMEYDAQRSQRQLVRQAQAASAVALSNQTSAGASTGIAGRTGSAVGGAQGGVQGSVGVQSNAIQQNLTIGEQLFKSNLKEGYELNEAQGQSGLVGLGNALSQIGGRGAVGNIGGTLAGWAQGIFNPSDSGQGQQQQSQVTSDWGYM